jgi:predicted nucleic acid-binding protein
MANEIFVDTSGLYSLLVAGDDGHKAARAILEGAAKVKRRFITTDYVLDETATLLLARGYNQLVAPMFEATLESSACAVEWSTPTLFNRTVAFLQRHLEHGWSFTDCMSFCVMKDRRLRDSLTKDVHFQQAGFVALLGRKR